MYLMICYQVSLFTDIELIFNSAYRKELSTIKYLTMFKKYEKTVF